MSQSTIFWALESMVITSDFGATVLMKYGGLWGSNTFAFKSCDIAELTQKNLLEEQ